MCTKETHQKDVVLRARAYQTKTAIKRFRFLHQTHVVEDREGW